MLNGTFAKHGFFGTQACQKCNKLSSNFIRRICKKKQIIAMKGSHYKLDQAQNLQIRDVDSTLYLIFMIHYS